MIVKVYSPPDLGSFHKVKRIMWITKKTHPYYRPGAVGLAQLESIHDKISEGFNHGFTMITDRLDSIDFSAQYFSRFNHMVVYSPVVYPKLETYIPQLILWTLGKWKEEWRHNLNTRKRSNWSYGDSGGSGRCQATQLQ